MQGFQLGEVELTNVVEWQGAIAPARSIVPESPPQLWRDNASWLVPEHWDQDTDMFRGAVQTWVLRSEGKLVLIDTGIGNGRNRPQIPLFDHLNTDFPGRLAAAGVRSEDVDLVVNTHIHYDHVGWNTRLQDGEWVPMFPNATYLLPRPDAEYFDPRHAHLLPAPRDEHERGRLDGARIVYADSIAPVLDRAVLWSGSYRIDGNLSLEQAPGHTPGSAIVRLASGTDRAAFVGDVVHSPVQILEPGYSSCFCVDRVQAARTRRRVLERAAETRELVVPAHFGGTGLVEVRRDGGGLTVEQWDPRVAG